MLNRLILAVADSPAAITSAVTSRSIKGVAETKTSVDNKAPPNDADMFTVVSRSVRNIVSGINVWSCPPAIATVAGTDTRSGWLLVTSMVAPSAVAQPLSPTEVVAKLCWLLRE